MESAVEGVSKNGNHITGVAQFTFKDTADEYLIIWTSDGVNGEENLKQLPTVTKDIIYERWIEKPYCISFDQEA